MKISLLKLISTSCIVLGLWFTFSSSSNGSQGTATGGCSCHGAASTNTTVTVNGFPVSYTYGATYPVSVTVSNATQLNAGFQLETNIGVLSGAGTNVFIPDAIHAHHSAPLSILMGEAVFTMNWTAPVSGNTALTVNAAANAIDGSGDNSGDEWNFAPSLNIPLPISLKHFGLIQKNNQTFLKWINENEQDLEEYRIEKSIDSKSYSTIETVNCKNEMINVYEYIDNDPKLGTSFYRLNMIHKNGKSTYSKIESCKNVGNQMFQIANNQINLLDYSKSLEIRINNMLGFVVLQSNEPIISTERLTSGLYLVTVINKKTHQILASEKYLKP